MPKYTPRRRRSIQRNRARIRGSIPRDKRHLLHWSAKGTHDDYEKLRQHAKRVRHRVPSYIDQAAIESIVEGASRRSLAENMHEDTFLDSLAWLIDQIPGGGWGGIKDLAQGALKPFRGDHLSEVDEQYARLVNEAYKESEGRDPTFEHWQHQKEFDSDYITVYDNEDNHRFVAVRGTKMNMKDLGEDALPAVVVHHRGHAQALAGHFQQGFAERSAAGDYRQLLARMHDVIHLQ